MRIAIVDILFKWPPSGGAGRDLFETLQRVAVYHEIQLFRPLRPGENPETDNIPLPCEFIQCDSWKAEHILARLLPYLDAWRPDVLFIGDGWMMKTRIASALSKKFPAVLRIYAYEMLCMRNNELWRHTHPCKFPAVHDWSICGNCASQYRDAILASKGEDNPLTMEMNAADIWNSTYISDIRTAMQSSAKIIVYNRMLADFIAKHYARNADVVPGGVNLKDFVSVRKLTNSIWSTRPLRVLGLGRMNDPAKGADDLIQAKRLLKSSDLSVEIVLTRNPTLNEPGIIETGWLEQKSVINELDKCHLVVVPSRWQESFGMAWLEAMAAGRPVISTKTAGPLNYLQNMENAILIPPGSPQDIAEAIQQITTDAGLRNALILKGRLKAESLSWDNAADMTRQIIENAVNESTRPHERHMPQRCIAGKSC